MGNTIYIMKFLFIFLNKQLDDIINQITLY